jgi:hypothetical protein
MRGCGVPFLLLTNFIFPQNPKTPLARKMGEENNIWICPAQNVGKRGKQKMIGKIIFGFALHKFPDGNFARARPRGGKPFSLRLQTHTTLRASNPCGIKQFMPHLIFPQKPKTPL